MEIRKAPNDTAALSFVANSEAARYVFVVVAAADVMIAGRRYDTFVLARCLHHKRASRAQSELNRDLRPMHTSFMHKSTKLIVTLGT